jgi:hypothetical protein
VESESDTKPQLPIQTHVFQMTTIFQHGEYEPAGTIEDYLVTHNQPHKILRLFEDDVLFQDPYRYLIILGSQMGTNNHHEFSVS